MKVSISASTISGTITAAASKSAMQRACALALLHTGVSVIRNPGNSNDDLAALSIIKELGAIVSNNDEGVLTIKGAESDRPSGQINCGESGLSIRMFTPIAALSSQSITINGSGSLLTRPMNFFDEILPQLQVAVSSKDGKLPITVKGPLQPAGISIDGSMSSQFLTGLLIAYASSCKEQVSITVNNLKSKPYIDLTLQMMQVFGYRVINNNYESFSIEPKKVFTDQTINYTVEGDWSGAAFLLVAGAIAGDVTVKGLDVYSAQADKAILQALMDCRSGISISAEEIVVKKMPLQAFHFNATDCPDLFPPLVALAAYCKGKTVIEGVSRLAHKESNRALTLQETFGRMGLNIQLQDDLMIIEGGGGLKGAAVHSHHDHRIAMAAAVAALSASGITVIEDAEAIDKSYPGFYAHMQQLGTAIAYPA